MRPGEELPGRRDSGRREGGKTGGAGGDNLQAPGAVELRLGNRSWVAIKV